MLKFQVLLEVLMAFCVSRGKPRTQVRITQTKPTYCKKAAVGSTLCQSDSQVAQLG